MESQTSQTEIQDKDTDGLFCTILNLFYLHRLVGCMYMLFSTRTLIGAVILNSLLRK
jgi:hypothetical protein